MALLSLQNARIAFGGHQLLNNVSLHIEKNQRICLLGRNGEGKSTLLKILAGEIAPDSGELHKDQSVRVSYFTQTIPQNLTGTAFEIIARGLGKRGELILKYHDEERRGSTDHRLLNALHEEMDAHQAWSALDAINKVVSQLSLDSEWKYAELSGGQKRRVLLAAALASEPDVLLLDEPTNHLDIQTVAWMEDFLIRLGVTLLFVTHDRMFLRRLATRIIELDRGELADWSCDYDTFLERKQALLENQEKEWERFDKKLAQEEIWIRRGIKARRTRNEGRVRELMAMREERKQRRQREGVASLKLADAQKSGKIVIEAQGVCYEYDHKPLIRNFNAIVARGDKIGVIGANGCGKTTLINLLIGNLKPQSGTIKLGTNLAITYFDQLREQIDENKTVWENVVDSGDFVIINGHKKHIISYLEDFLFTPERAKTPVSHLSGGERNRLLLARLFTKPSNLLVLDEPTNDLDAETLELLEELLVEFAWTILLICHDRTFLNNVVTSTFVFGKDGKIEEFVGGYDDWLAQRTLDAPLASVEATDKKRQFKEAQKAKQKRKLSFSEQKELGKLPTLIDKLEQEQAALSLKMADSNFYRDVEAVKTANLRLAQIEQELLSAYERWEFLEAIAN